MTEALKGGSNFWVCRQNLWCDHSNETSSAVLSHGTIYIVCFSNLLVYGWNPMVWAFKWNIFSSTFTRCYLFSSSSNFWVCGPNPIVLPFKWNLFRSTFTWYYLYSMFFQLSTKSVMKSNSNETPLVVLSRATICFPAFYKMKFGVFAIIIFLCIQVYVVLHGEGQVSNPIELKCEGRHLFQRSSCDVFVVR